MANISHFHHILSLHELRVGSKTEPNRHTAMWFEKDADCTVRMFTGCWYERGKKEWERRERERWWEEWSEQREGGWAKMDLQAVNNLAIGREKGRAHSSRLLLLLFLLLLLTAWKALLFHSRISRHLPALASLPRLHYLTVQCTRTTSLKNFKQLTTACSCRLTHLFLHRFFFFFLPAFSSPENNFFASPALASQLVLRNNFHLSSRLSAGLPS